jgi:hypothetical protein
LIHPGTGWTVDVIGHFISLLWRIPSRPGVNGRAPSPFGVLGTVIGTIVPLL